MKTTKRFEIFIDPEKHGYVECTNCNGYGSSLKENRPICSKCYGLRLVKKKRKTNK